MSDHQRSTVTVYTSHEQTEQGQVIYHVTALTVVGGLLTIEAEVDERGHTFSAFHRFEGGKWAHFSVSYFGRHSEQSAADGEAR